MLTKVAITGKMGAGKDMIAGILIVNHGFVNFKNSGALKDMTRAYLAHRGIAPSQIERFIEGDLKESPCWLFEDKSCRQFMQHLGTEFGRELIGPDLWVKATRDHGYPERAVCTDVRFDNEAQALKDAGFVIWHKKGRKGKDRSGEVHQHVSEAGISGHLVDEVIPYIQDEEVLKAFINDLLYKYEVAVETFGPIDGKIN